MKTVSNWLKQSYYFPIKTRHTDAVGLTTVQINILLQMLWIAMHGNKHVDMISSLLKVVKIYLLIYYRVLE